MRRDAPPTTAYGVASGYALFFMFLPLAVHAQAVDAPSDGPPAGTAATTTPIEAGDPERAVPYRLGGYVEAFYQWNFNAPSNRITHFRGFDNRHNAFTIANAALDAQWDDGALLGRLTLQVGHTPSTYYMAEPEQAASAGTNATGTELWKYIQQAYAGYRFGAARQLTIAAGIFLSPIGPEALAIHDSWNWSRSNLFFGLPFYHTGLRATYALTEAWSVTLAGYNGWNSVVDNNDAKSVSAQLTYAQADVDLSFVYFGGVERPDGAPEGKPWRHLFDVHGAWHAAPWLSLLAQANTGFEHNRYGMSHWVAGALYGRFRVLPALFFTLRGDGFYERVAEGVVGRADAIFWPVPWVASATATFDYRPHDQISFRLEYRHDHAADDMYFGSRVPRDGFTLAYVPNRRAQDTLTAGVTSWF